MNGNSFKNGEKGATPEEFSEGSERDIYDNAVKSLSGTDQDNKVDTSKLIEKVKQISNNDYKDGQIYNIILRASKNPTSPIQSKKGRGGGYYIDQSAVEEAAEFESQSRASTADQLYEPQYPSDKTLEKHIWPLVSLWLKSQKGIKQASHEYANLKSGGKWGNPDVLALRPLDRLGFFDVEIISVEVKPSTVDWRYYFFEAVSHKRFAERVYYAFRTSGSELKNISEILDYAEKYRVGIVKIELDDAQYDSLISWSKKSDSEKLQLVDQVIEIAPAPFDPVNLSEKLEFFDRIGIKHKEQFYVFGSGSA